MLRVEGKGCVSVCIRSVLSIPFKLASDEGRLGIRERTVQETHIHTERVTARFYATGTFLHLVLCEFSCTGFFGAHQNQNVNFKRP